MKIIVPFRSCPMRNRKFQKNNKKIQKIKKYHYEFNSSQNRLEKDEKERNKNYRSILFRSYLMRNRKFYKNSKKFKKKKVIQLWFISSQNRSEKDEKYGK